MPSSPAIVPVNLGHLTYDVHIGTGLLAHLSDHLALVAKPSKVFVVTSPEIWSLWSDAFLASFSIPPHILTIPAGEQHKRLSTLESLAEQMSAAGADRDSLLIAFGGGVIGDMVGFLAAMYMRGIRFVQVPTTALAQIDSSVGGKTGVNLAIGKNLIGAFHHPLTVFADIDTLRTLPARELRAGLQESVKAGIIRDRALFDYMERNAAAILSGSPEHLAYVIAASVRMKATVVANDERETGERMLLNLGHTLGHAIETATGYTQLLHGEAIAWGMLAATAIAHRRGLLTLAEHDRVERVIVAYGPLRRFHADPAHLVALTAKDKKHRSGVRSFVLPRGIGDAIVVKDVTVDELTYTAGRMMAMAATQDAA